MIAPPRAPRQAALVARIADAERQARFAERRNLPQIAAWWLRRAAVGRAFLATGKGETKA